MAPKTYCGILFGFLIWRLVHAHPPTYGRSEVVDLGYAKHVPTWTNTTSAGTQLLNYNNIRYAQAPTGEKRFRKPKTPPAHQRGIQTGNRTSWETDCISSAHPSVPFPLLNGTTWGSEDCLFLNVIKPKHAKEGDRLPVLHWVVGSAYSFGGKDWTGFGINTYGLYNRLLNLTDQFIIVTHNYRLGVSGWLPKFEDNMNGNLGVWDTLAATEWTKKYICKFGGDPDNITVIGQSAGAGIIAWLLLAEEGTMKLPFDQAWIASPAIAPRRDLQRSRPIFDMVLNKTGCGDVQCLRHLPESTIKEVNEFLFFQNPSSGGGSLGPPPGLTPTVDGELVSDLPASAFAAGKFNKRIKQLVVGNTAGEGLYSSDRDMPNRFPEIVRANIPNASNASIARLQVMYPYPPELPEKLAWDFVTDIDFACPAYTIAEAYKDRARRYVFSVPPAYHGQDLSYFFFANNGSTPVDNITTAWASESYLLQYMFRGNLHAKPALSAWPYVAEKDTLANITLDGYGFAPLANNIRERCDFINALAMDPANDV